MDALGLEPCLRGQLAQDQERACAGQCAAAGVEEEVGPVAAVEVRAAERQVAAHGLGGRAAERDDALLVALADHSHDARVDVDRRAGQSDRLRDAQAGAVHQLDEGAVAHRPWRRPVRRLDQALGLERGERARQLADPARRRDLGGRVVGARPSRTWWRNAERTAAIRRAIVEGASPAARIDATQASSDSVVAVEAGASRNVASAARSRR